MAVSTFCGRETELAALENAWARVTAGDGPRVVALLAESGLGKTRLAQEFFARLAASTGGGYWPPTLGQDGNSLRVNPVAKQPEAPHAMPWLWWGLRLVDPLSPNSVGAGILHSDYERHLRPHIEPFRRVERRRQRRKEALDVGKGVLLDVAIDLVPFGGLAKTLGEAGRDLYGLYRDDRQDQAGKDGGESLSERILEDLAVIFEPEDGDPLPAVILIDDAQFSGNDPAVVAFVTALCRRASHRGWPMLLLVTHWEKEWDAAPPGTVAAHLRALAGPPLSPIRLRPVPDLALMLASALPGLTSDQSRTILDRADGNPRFLNEMILFAIDSRGAFEGRDTARALTERGLARLMAESTELHRLIRSRLTASPVAVQEAVCLASLQGMEFLRSVLGATADGLQADGGAVADAVSEAETPHAYVSRIDPGIAAFAQRVYFEVAQEHLENCFDPDEAREVLENVLRDCMRNRYAEFHGEELHRLLVLAAALFEGAEPIPDRYIAASALHLLARNAMAMGDWIAAWAFAGRLDALIESSGDEVLDENLNWLRLIYAAADGPEARDIERRVLDKMVRLTTDTYQEDANDWSTRMLLKALLLSANHLLDNHDPQGAFRHLKDAGDVLGQWAFEEQSAENLQAWADYHETTSLMFLYLDRPAEALQQSEALIGIAERMESLSPGFGNHTIMRASGSQRAAMLSFRLQDGVAARRHFDAALSVHRTIVDEMGVAGMESNLLDVVMEYSGFLTAQSENPEAAALLADAAARARRLVQDADLAIHRRTLAGVLLRQAQTERLGGRLDTARDAAREALSLCERDEDHDPAPEAYLPTLHAELAELALASGTAADALAHATQSRERALAELQRRASMPGRGRLLRATALLVDAQQGLGHYRDAELTLRDAEAQVQAFDAEERSRFVDYIQRLVAASTAQPSLS